MIKAKVVITRGVVEVTTYDRLNTKPPKPDIQNGEGIQKEENYKNTQRKRRNTVRQTITNNFDAGDRFVTLSYANTDRIDITNPLETNKDFTNFVKRLKRSVNVSHGLAVIEFQDLNGRGAVHYHLIIKGDYIPATTLRQLWGHGHVKINQIKHVDNIGAYVIKYMHKDMDDQRLQGKRAYLTFGDLTKPETLRSWKTEDRKRLEDIDAMLKEKSPVYSSQYTSDQCGTITYLQYNVNKKKPK